MSLKKLQYVCAAAFLLTSFVTYKPVLEIFSPLHSKVLLSRVFAFPLIVLTAALLIFTRGEERRIPPVYKYYFLFLSGLAATLPFSLAPAVSARYFLSILFGGLVSFSIYHTFRHKPLGEFFKIVWLTLLLASLIALINLSLSQLGIDPPLGEFRTDAAIGLFKRFHEGGIFAFSMLLILLSVEFSGDASLFPYKQWLLRTGLFLGSMFLLASGKISNLVGLAAALLLYLLYFRNRESLKKVSVFAGVVLVQLLLFFWLYRPVFDRITYRIQSRITHRTPGTLEADFVVDNLSNSLRAFTENPFTGTGLGAYQLFYGTPGIHGFYLRIAGEAGLIGLIAFVLFLLAVIRHWILKTNKSKVSVNTWHNHFFPLFGGILVSWLYNYELTNPVFWALLAALALGLKQGSADRKQ